jgi:hypothetical protein
MVVHEAGGDGSSLGDVRDRHTIVPAVGEEIARCTEYALARGKAIGRHTSLHERRRLLTECSVSTMADAPALVKTALNPGMRRTLRQAWVARILTRRPAP